MRTIIALSHLVSFRLHAKVNDCKKEQVCLLIDISIHISANEKEITGRILSINPNLGALMFGWIIGFKNDRIKKSSFLANWNLWRHMITEYKHNPPIPYSLHDMVVNKIVIDEERIILEFEHGYVSLVEPYNQVEGNIVINEVDFDFVCVVLQSKNGEHGKFQGDKLSLKEFLEKYDNYCFEIVDEMYGYNQVWYSGYLSNAGEENLIEMEIAIYFAGNIVYETEE